MKLTSLTPMLGVADIELSIAFYRDAVGFELEDTHTPPGAKKPSWAHMRHGSIEIMLSDHAGASGPEAQKAHADAQLYLRTDNVLAIADRAKSAGAHVGGPWVRFYGIKEIELSDPDGYRLVIGENGENTDEPPTPEA